MDEKMKKLDRRKYQYLQWLSPLITIITLLIGAIVWINTMSGIPPRVTKAEERISELEKSQTAMNVKADMTLNAIYEIRSVLMKGK
jgi:uncharacterized membrane protein YagU involved in acid resistance